MKNKLHISIMNLEDEIKEFLFQMVSTPSYFNQELEMSNYCFKKFSELEGLEIKKIYMDDEIKTHPLYCTGMGNTYKGNYNIEIILRGTGEKDPIYLNAHMDTVPVSEGNEKLLEPEMKNDTIYGLGACDDKGGIAAIYATFKTLIQNDIKLSFDLIGHLVVEEEIGGNGTLKITDKPMKGQSAIVMEPSGNEIYCSHRAALWIKINCTGQACHTGSKMASTNINALDVALLAINILKKMHGKYVEECRVNPVRYFEKYLPFLNVGIVKCGDWPGTVPSKGAVLASVGILPNLNTYQMKERIREAFSKEKSLIDNTQIEYIFERNFSILEYDSPLVLDIVTAAKHIKKLKPSVMNAICDKYFYQELHGIPAVSFGPGEIKNAHSKNEQVNIKDVLETVEILCEYIINKV